MSTEKTFGETVKNRRRELGLTQDELARRVGCAPITVRKIESDDLRPEERAQYGITDTTPTCPATLSAQP